MDHEHAKVVAEAFVRALEDNDMEVFDDDVFCDINVPEWRFQMQGRDAAASWLAQETGGGCGVPSWRCEPTPSGVVVELVQQLGDDISRNMHLLEVSGSKVTAWTMYCTGVWSPATQAKQAAEAPMFRP